MNEEQDVQTKCVKWGLLLEEIKLLPERLLTFHQRYSMYMRTLPHDKSEYGLNYMSGLVRIETDRTIANRGREVGVSIQNMAPFHQQRAVVWAKVGRSHSRRCEGQCNLAKP